MRRTAAALLLAALAPLAGCSKHVSFSGEVKLQPTAEENYQAGQDLMQDQSWPEAVKFFEHVRTKFPFSKFAALSDLRLADARFEQQKYGEAADGYLQFVQLHPTHAEVDYAEWRVGLAYYKDAPGDWALFPSSYEKDLRQVQKSSEALHKFVEKHPKSRYLPEAKALLDTVDGRLVAHEWYVAEYYYKRERWAGAAGRYEGIVARYPGSKYEVEALLKTAKACVAIDEKFRARTALQKLIVAHPQDPRRAEAEKLLATLR